MIYGFSQLIIKILEYYHFNYAKIDESVQSLYRQTHESKLFDVIYAQTTDQLEFSVFVE